MGRTYYPLKQQKNGIRKWGRDKNRIWDVNFWSVKFLQELFLELDCVEPNDNLYISSLPFEFNKQQCERIYNTLTNIDEAKIIQAIIELEKRNGYNDEQISKIVNGYKQNGVIEYLIDKLPTYFDMTNYVGLKTDW